MPSIGQFNFTGWRGRIRPSNRVIDVMTPAVGVDGNIATIGGWRAAATTIVTTVDVQALNLVIQAINGYRNTEGTLVAVVDPFGITWSSVFVQSAISDYDLLVTGGFRVTTSWTLVPQSAQPP